MTHKLYSIISSVRGARMANHLQSKLLRTLDFVALWNNGDIDFRYGSHIYRAQLEITNDKKNERIVIKGISKDVPKSSVAWIEGVVNGYIRDADGNLVPPNQPVKPQSPKDLVVYSSPMPLVVDADGKPVAGSIKPEVAMAEAPKPDVSFTMECTWNGLQGNFVCDKPAQLTITPSTTQETQQTGMLGIRPPSHSDLGKPVFVGHTHEDAWKKADAFLDAGLIDSADPCTKYRLHSIQLDENGNCTYLVVYVPTGSVYHYQHAVVVAELPSVLQVKTDIQVGDWVLITKPKMGFSTTRWKATMNQLDGCVRQVDEVKGTTPWDAKYLVKLDEADPKPIYVLHSWVTKVPAPVEPRALPGHRLLNPDEVVREGDWYDHNGIDTWHWIKAISSVGKTVEWLHKHSSLGTKVQIARKNSSKAVSSPIQRLLPAKDSPTQDGIWYELRDADVLRRGDYFKATEKMSWQYVDGLSGCTVSSWQKANPDFRACRKYQPS